MLKRSKPDLNLEMDELPIEHALGIRWSVEDDTLGFEMRSLVRPKTKCGILSTVCSLFDSLSFAAPVALSARCLVQDLWKANIGWDEPLSEEFLSKWRAWSTELPLLSELFIPRSYFLSDGDPQQCFMCFQMPQRLVMEHHHHICEASTPMDEFIALSSLVRLGMRL